MFAQLGLSDGGAASVDFGIVKERQASKAEGTAATSSTGASTPRDDHEDRPAEVRHGAAHCGNSLDDMQHFGSVMSLRPAVKDFAWGIRGSDSRVARYALEMQAITHIEPSKPYAELWLGTHPEGPSMTDDGTPLEEVLGGPLPFLLKVLSAGKALSIQAHPSKSIAERLHREDPENYKDDNHKPEMAIALTPFEAMCGFRRLDEITVHLRKHPEFTACISKEAVVNTFMAHTEEEKQEALRNLFSSFMSCDREVSLKQLSTLLERLRKEQNFKLNPHDESPWERKASRAILRLSTQFPGDPGAMAPLFLNYLLIAPGESFFMAANEPHAYVAGEIIECMACSNNTVRAGLTGKFTDVPNLVSMLSYTMGGPLIEVGEVLNGGRTVRYTPPVSEFEVEITTVEPGESFVLEPLHVPSILICVEGKGSTEAVSFDASTPVRRHQYELRPGRSLFLSPSSMGLDLRCSDKQCGPLRVVVAHENLHMADQ